MVTVDMIKDMQHAIGMRRDRIKRYKYLAFRNHFCTDIDNQNWQYLRSQGYATSVIFQGQMYYSVLRKGLDLLESITFMKIEETY